MFFKKMIVVCVACILMSCTWSLTSKKTGNKIIVSEDKVEVIGTIYENDDIAIETLVNGE